jgi:hypothetical protein
MIILRGVSGIRKFEEAAGGFLSFCIQRNINNREVENWQERRSIGKSEEAKEEGSREEKTLLPYLTYPAFSALW